MRTRYVGVYATIPVGGAASGEDIDMAVWEPTSLQAQPWTSVYVGSQLHLVKGVFHEAGYEVLCWDKRTMWEEKVGGGEMTERMKKLNPNVEAPVSLVVGQLSTLLKTPHTQYSEETTPTRVGGARKTLLIDGTLSGLPFVWQLQFTAATEGMVQTHLIDPLAGSLMELCRQKEELVGIIKRKDREIQDYRDSGATVTRRHLETSTFDESTFNSTMASSQGFEDCVRNSTEIFARKDFQSLCCSVGSVSVRLEREMTEHCPAVTNTAESAVTPATADSAPSPATATVSERPPALSPAKEEEELSRRIALQRKLEEERLRGKKKKKRLM